MSDAVPPSPRAARPARPWVTWLALLGCGSVFLALQVHGDRESWTTWARYGHLPSIEVWDGGWWALVTSVFVHAELWHVAFNAYWLWLLGSCLEREIGSLRYLAFFVAAAFVSSSFQMAATDDTGIGASGVVYAIFGVMWPLRRRVPRFGEAMGNGIVVIFVAWLVGCIVASALGLWIVGNAAHVAGLLFGVSVAGAFYVRTWRRPALAGMLLLAALSVVWLLWCPWCAGWVALRAQGALENGDYEDAVALASRAIELDPGFAWPHSLRSNARERLGQPRQALEDYERARSLDPAFEDQARWFILKAYDASMEKRHEEVVRYCTSLIGLQPENAWAHWTRGVSQKAIGATEAAEADFRRARELDPEGFAE